MAIIVQCARRTTSMFYGSIGMETCSMHAGFGPRGPRSVVEDLDSDLRWYRVGRSCI